MRRKMTLAVAAVATMALTSAAAAADCDIEIALDQAGAGGLTPLSADTTPAESNFVPGELIIGLRSTDAFQTFSTSPPALPEIEGVTLVPDTERTSGPGEVHVKIVTFTAQSTEGLKSLTERVRDELLKREDVEFVDLNYIVSAKAAPGPNDPCYRVQWHYWENGAFAADAAPGGINLPAAWTTNTGSADVVVAVVDTGQTMENPDIDPAHFVAGYDFVNDDTDPTDLGDGTGWHGTHVSGTIGSLFSNNQAGAASANWQVKIQAVRVLGTNGSGTLAAVVNGVRWAAGVSLSGVPENETPARIINLSLGVVAPCASTQSLQRAINEARDRGVLVVVAAGNEHMDAAGASPASCDNVLAVAGGDAEGRLVGWYSNYGPTVDILAPGGDTRSDLNGDGLPDGVLSTIKDGFAFYNGTSMAAPHVAGVAALVAAKWPALGPDEIEKKILDRALPRTPAECPKPCGKGLLNADLF